MSKYIQVRNIKIGDGIPKICVPIMGATKEDILRAAKGLSGHSYDLVEWRADCYDDVFKNDEVLTVLTELRKILTDCPILFTFRTAAEGGEKSITPERYKDLLMTVCNSKLADIVDVEIFLDDSVVIYIFNKAKETNVYTIASNHDFKATPDKEEIISRLHKMHDMGADILKIAVMPNCKSDVLTLLSATVEANEQMDDACLVTISMGAEGLISRICGEFSGSSITFGAVGKTSAPGQIDSNELSNILNTITKNRA